MWRSIAACSLLLMACDASDRHATASGPTVVPSAVHAPASPASAEANSAKPGASTTAVPAPSGDLDVPPNQIYEPSVAAGERRPLLIFLHGLGASGLIGFQVVHLARFGAAHRIFVIAPDGSMDSRGRRFWNAGPSCCNFDHRNIDDIARIDRLIDRWTARPGVDPKRVYVLGYSNGGFMAHRLACRLSSRIAAVASAAGAAPAPNEECTVNSKIGVLEVHGDADTVVKYEGGTVFRDANLAPHLSAAETLKSWSTRLGCSGKVKTGQSLDLDPRLPSLETRVEHFSDCAHGSVALWTVHGGTHYIGSTPQALEEAWKFFEAHSK